MLLASLIQTYTIDLSKKLNTIQNLLKHQIKNQHFEMMKNKECDLQSHTNIMGRRYANVKIDFNYDIVV